MMYLMSWGPSDSSCMDKGEKAKMDYSKLRAISLMFFSILFLVLAISNPVKGASNPGEKGPCTAASQEVEIAGAPAKVFYPSTISCADFAQKPFPAIAFAHGFSMFGLSDGMSENEANGEHLASWGYVVVIPALPDDAEERLGLLIDALDFLEAANADPGSFLYGKVDTNRLTTAGYSLGGATALAVAARDNRVTAVVALDPVYHTGSFGGEGEMIWDPAEEAPRITIPTAILGAPPSSCNAEADYAEIYPHVGSAHKGAYLIRDASHCVFADPGTSFCSFICGGGTNPEMTTASKKYMSAWFNYYVQLKPEYYDFLFGTQAQADVDTGLIKLTTDTATTNLVAGNFLNNVQLTWDSYNHPILAGYQIYRQLAEDPSFGPPLVNVGLIDSYIDSEAVRGQKYIYAVRSFDTAGNMHNLSKEVEIILDPNTNDTIKYYLPMAKSP